MKIKEDYYLAHYGIPRRSGRYPYGIYDTYNKDITTNKEYSISHKELNITGKPLSSPEIKNLTEKGKNIFENIGNAIIDIASDIVDEGERFVNELIYGVGQLFSNTDKKTGEISDFFPRDIKKYNRICKDHMVKKPSIKSLFIEE